MPQRTQSQILWQVAQPSGKMPLLQGMGKAMARGDTVSSGATRWEKWRGTLPGGMRSGAVKKPGGGHACGARAGRRKRCAGRRANGPAPRAQLGNLLRRRAVLPARRARFFTGCPLGWPGSAYFASGVYFIIE